MRKIFKNELFPILLGAFLFAMGLTLTLFELHKAAYATLLLALVVSGFRVFITAVRGILRLDFFDEKFLMTVASVAAFLIGEMVEGVAVMLFFLVGEYFEHKAVRRSRNSIKALMDICPDTATVIVDGVEEERDAEEVLVGEEIVIRSGQRVPVDAVVLSGASSVDTSALTGEHLPREVSVGDVIESGTVLVGGAVRCRVLKIAEESSALRVISLVEAATERKSREESFITRFSRYYTPTVTALAVLMAVLPPVFGILEFRAAVYRALSFLVVSCPCALVISVPMAFFGGIGNAARHGILLKGGNVFSPLSKIESVCFDKTGTLTTGKLTVAEVYAKNGDAAELLSLAASAEYPSEHPIALAIKSAAGQYAPASEYNEIAGQGVIATVGAFVVAVGNGKLMEKQGAVVTDARANGAVCVAKGSEYLGYISFTDKPKPEARDAISALRKLGAKRVAILSGDGKGAVSSVAGEVGIEEAHAGLLPVDKFNILESVIQSTHGSTLYVGDGINDAPCLARADVGIAMGAHGTDSASEASDAVLMSDKLDRLPHAVKIARKTLFIAKQNIVFTISVKLLVLLLVSFNLAGMWMAVFSDVGVAVLAILNAMRVLKYKPK